jgi:hypothetical protein
VVVGRDTSAGISINDTMASRNHFRVEARSGAFFLVDLNSKNGTLLNGSRVKESRIQSGDRIQVGETVFSLMEDVKPKEELVGRIVGRRYKILERIGRGGMGTVYKAEQIRLNRNVALKMLQQELVNDPQFIKKFMDEARAAAQFNHPNVVTVYEIDVDSEMTPPVPFIAMEYLPGGSLQDLLSKEKKLPPERALAVILDAARGLEYAEKKQIVHRDIKPDNLMISEDGRIKIGDLGLAKSLKADGARPEAPEGVFGTPHYIAPEQALNKPIDIRADIYALGASFFRILSGTTPYQGSSAKEIIVNKLRDAPPPLDVVDPSIPKPLVAIVDRMMRKEPAERPGSAKELVSELDRIRRELAGSMTGPVAMGAEAVPGSSSSATATAVGVEGRRQAAPMIVLMGAAAMLIVTVAIVAVTLFKGDGGGGEGNGGPSPDPNGGNHSTDAPNEEGAKTALEFIERQVPGSDLTNPEVVRRLVDAYGAIVTDFPGTAAAKKAREQMDIYQNLLSALAASALWVAAENQRLKWESARKSFGADKASFEEVDRAAGAAMSAYGELILQFPDDQNAQKAKEASEAIDRDMARFRERHYAWRDEQKAIGEAIDQKKYGDAHVRIDAAERGGEFRDYGTSMRSLKERLSQEAKAAFNDVATRVENKRTANDFEAARALIAEGRAWKYPEFAPLWDSLGKAVDKAEEDWKGQEARKVRESQEAALREARLRAIDAARAKFDFAAGSAKLKAGLAGVRDRDLLDQAEAWRRDFDAAATLLPTLQRKIELGGLRSNASVSFEKIRGGGKPIEATAESITVQLQERAQASVFWKDVKTSEWRSLMRTWDHDAATAAGLVSADLILGLAKDIDADIGNLEKVAEAADAPLVASVKLRAGGLKGSLHEDEAMDRMEQARLEIQRSRWQRALDDLNEISTRLNSTRYYADRRAEIDSLQEQCKDKLK